MNWNLLANFSIAIFAILNPLGKIPVWTELTGGDKAEIRNRVAALAVVTGMAVLLVFLVGGKQILIAFSIDMPSFRIAGGILVLLTAISMVKGNLVASPTPEETEGTVKEAARKRFQAIVVPLAVPMLAGPGTITTVMAYSVKAENWTDVAGMSGVLVLSYVIVFAILKMAAYLERRIDYTVFVIITRIFGLILAGIAVQLMLEGLGEAFPQWLEGGQSIIEESVEENKSVSGPPEP